MSKFFSRQIMLLSAITVLSGTLIVNASNPKLIINGKNINCTVPPVEKNNTTLVPFRAIGEALGAKIEWKSSKKQVILTSEDTKIVLTIGSKQATVNCETKNLSVAPEIINETVMVPVRFVSENLSSTVNWDKHTNTIHINNDSNTYTDNQDSSTQIKNYEWGIMEWEGDYSMIINITCNGYPNIPGSTISFQVKDAIFDYKLFETISSDDGVFANKELWSDMVDEVYGGDGIFGFVGDKFHLNVEELDENNLDGAHIYFKGGNQEFTITWNTDGSITVDNGVLVKDSSLYEY